MFIQIFELIVIFFIDSLNAIYKVEGVDLYHILIVFLCFNSGGGYSFEKNFFLPVNLVWDWLRPIEIINIAVQKSRAGEDGRLPLQRWNRWGS